MGLVSCAIHFPTNHKNKKKKTVKYFFNFIKRWFLSQISVKRGFLSLLLALSLPLPVATHIFCFFFKKILKVCIYYNYIYYTLVRLTSLANWKRVPSAWRQHVAIGNNGKRSIYEKSYTIHNIYTCFRAWFYDYSMTMST